MIAGEGTVGGNWQKRMAEGMVEEEVVGGEIEEGERSMVEKEMGMPGVRGRVVVGGVW